MNNRLYEHYDGMDWEEDFQHENGCYQCKCCECDQYFIGHKRRVICKKCAYTRVQEELYIAHHDYIIQKSVDVPVDSDKEKLAEIVKECRDELVVDSIGWNLLNEKYEAMKND